MESNSVLGNLPILLDAGAKVVTRAVSLSLRYDEALKLNVVDMPSGSLPAVFLAECEGYTKTVLETRGGED